MYLIYYLEYGVLVCVALSTSGHIVVPYLVVWRNPWRKPLSPSGAQSEFETLIS